MIKSIQEYQKAFNSLIDRMKADEKILSVMVFGSMVTGDFWEGSDIDLMVVADIELEAIRDVYTEELEIPIHIKLMGKENYLKIYEEYVKGGYIHRIFSSSKLVFSKDLEITSTYDRGRFLPDIDRERWNMVFLGGMLKDVSECKKFLHNDVMYNCYSLAVKCTRNFAKLYINHSGYMISRDVITMAMNLNDEFKNCVEELFAKGGDTHKAIENTINFIEKYIEKNIKGINAVLLNYMREKDMLLSSVDMKQDSLFVDFKIDFEQILNKLWKMNIIKKTNRPFEVEKGKGILTENVYYI